MSLLDQQMQCPCLSELPAPPPNKKGWPWTEETGRFTYQTYTIAYPKISIVTPSYNQGQYLEETIRSVLLQGYPNIEFIIIDGGSTDNSIEIIRKYEPWISYWISEQDKGQSDAINKGFAKCTGDIFNWLNSDDYYEKAAFYKIAEAFSQSNIHILTGWSNVLNHRGDNFKMKGFYVKTEEEKASGLSRLYQPSTFVKRSIFNQIGLLNIHLHYVMDVEWYFRYFLYFGQNQVQEVEATFTNLRFHDNSKTIKYGYLFNKEINLIYYQLALFNNNVAASVIASIFDFSDLSNEYKLEINYDLLKDREYILQTTISYYLYDYYLKFYHSGEFKKAKYLLPSISKDLLSEDDKKNLKIAKFKIGYLIPFVKIYRWVKAFVAK